MMHARIIETRRGENRENKGILNATWRFKFNTILYLFTSLRGWTKNVAMDAELWITNYTNFFFFWKRILSFTHYSRYHSITFIAHSFSSFVVRQLNNSTVNSTLENVEIQNQNDDDEPFNVILPFILSDHSVWL